MVRRQSVGDREKIDPRAAVAVGGLVDELEEAAVAVLVVDEADGEAGLAEKLG